MPNRSLCGCHGIADLPEQLTVFSNFSAREIVQGGRRIGSNEARNPQLYEIESINCVPFFEGCELSHTLIFLRLIRLYFRPNKKETMSSNLVAAMPSLPGTTPEKRGRE